MSAATGAIATALYSTGRSDAAYRFLVGNSPLVVLAAVFMSASTVIVAINAQFLRFYRRQS